MRFGDVLPSGEVRLDSVVRYLQDVATDDGLDAVMEPELGWVTRKTVLDIRRRPRTGQQLHLATWASGVGSRWAERRTTITVKGETAVEAAALWVCVDMATMRPAKLSPRFWHVYGEAIGDRRVPGRLVHAAPAPGLVQGARRWPLRISDFDIFDHVNNAATWMPVEEELLRVAGEGTIRWVELEYRAPIERCEAVDVISQADASVARVWLMSEGAVLSSALAAIT